MRARLISSLCFQRSNRRIPDLVYMISLSSRCVASYEAVNGTQDESQALCRRSSRIYSSGDSPRMQGKASEKIVSADLWHQSLPFPGAKSTLINSKEV